MIKTQRASLDLVDILNAANEHYMEKFLALYFNSKTGEPKVGDGDTLANFIVHELRETFVGRVPMDQQIEAAVSVLERGKDDIQKAIDGLLELRK